MGKKKARMIVAGRCRVCGVGPLGLRRCGACGGVALVCDECDSAWSDAAAVAGPPSAGREDLPCPRCGVGLWQGEGARWAAWHEARSEAWVADGLRRGALRLEEGAARAP